MSAPPPSPTAAQAEVLAQTGRVAEAFGLLDTAAQRGDAWAALTLADWRISGQLVRRDIAEARRLFGLAAEGGIEDADEVFIALLANGAGGTPRCWSNARERLAKRAKRHAMARRQADLLARMAIDDAGNPLSLPEAEPVSEIPRIILRRGFLTPGECQYLAERALPALQPAIVIHPQTGQAMLDPVRTAHSAAFPFVREDPVIHAINRRIMAATGTSYEQGEPIQVLSYQPGQEYKLHSDCLPPGQNQREQTFLVTLSDQFTGGETSFPRIGLNLRAGVGDAVHFINVDAKGQPEPLAWHAGLPVRTGRKLLLSKWIRKAPLDLGGPPGRPF